MLLQSLPVVDRLADQELIHYWDPLVDHLSIRQSNPSHLAIWVADRNHHQPKELDLDLHLLGDVAFVDAAAVA